MEVTYSLCSLYSEWFISDRYSKSRDKSLNMQIACHLCDLICQVPELADDQVALCPVCEGMIGQNLDSHLDNVIPMSISALILLACSLPFTFISFSRQGIVQSIGLLDAAEMMLQYGQPFLASLINLTIILLPASILTFNLLLHAKVVSWLPKEIQIFFTKAVFQAKEWCMPEIFLVGVLVSLVKITSLADVEIGMSFWAFAGFVFCFIFTLVKLNKMATWDYIAHHSQFMQALAGVRAIDENLAACPQCDILTLEKHCPRCSTEVTLRDPHNLQKTLAWTITSGLLYIPANLYPITTTVLFTDAKSSTLIEGVALLWQSGSYPVALVIFVASVVIPLAKLAILASLCWVVKRRVKFSQLSFTKIYAVTEFLGKWSMMDVFVVAVLVALVHLGGIMEVIPGPGALFFSAMVIASMLAVHTFDPRQLWDIKQKEEAQ